MSFRESVNERAPDWLRVGYGTAYINTQRGKNVIDTIAAPKAAWKLWNNVGLLVAVAAMFAAVAVLVRAGIVISMHPPEPSAAYNPKNMVAIPGMNDFLPLSAFAYIISMYVLALGVHEAAHAVSMRVENISLSEFGVVLLGPLPLGAYVLPEDEFDDAPVMSRLRTFAAGPMANIGLIVTALVVAVITGAQPAAAYNAYLGSIIGVTVPAADVALGFWDNLVYWALFANVNLAMMNVLPIIGLDGGQIVRDIIDSRATDSTTKVATRVATGAMVLTVVVVMAAPHVAEVIR